MSKHSAETEGYKRGLEGKGLSRNVVSSLFDVFESDAEREAREEGFEQGQRDRARIEKENE